MSALKNRIQDDMKSAMRAKEQKRLNTIRLILAAIKQKEVDERIDCDDQHVLAILDKLTKQRRESISQYESAGRQDLASQEKYELELIQTYLPAQLSDAEIDQMVTEAIEKTSANSIKDMGKVIGILKPKLQGRADMGAVSAKIKGQLS